MVSTSPSGQRDRRGRRSDLRGLRESEEVHGSDLPESGVFFSTSPSASPGSGGGPSVESLAAAPVAAPGNGTHPASVNATTASTRLARGLKASPLRQKHQADHRQGPTAPVNAPRPCPNAGPAATATAPPPTPTHRTSQPPPAPPSALAPPEDARAKCPIAVSRTRKSVRASRTRPTPRNCRRRALLPGPLRRASARATAFLSGHSCRANLRVPRSPLRACDSRLRTVRRPPVLITVPRRGNADRPQGSRITAEGSSSGRKEPSLSRRDSLPWPATAVHRHNDDCPLRRDGHPGAVFTHACGGTTFPPRRSVTLADERLSLDRSRRPTPWDSPHAHNHDCPSRRDSRPVAMFTHACGGTTFPPRRGLTSRKGPAILVSRSPDRGAGLTPRRGERASPASAGASRPRPSFPPRPGKALAKTRSVRRRVGRAGAAGSHPRPEGAPAP